MNKTDVKALIKEGIIAMLVILPPSILVLIMGGPFVLLIWMIGLLVIRFKRRENPQIAEESRVFRNFERLLYFQIINWSFGFFFVFGIFTILIPVVLIVFAMNKERRADPTFIKWAKYVGFHTFSLSLVMGLLFLAPNMGEPEVVLIALPMIAFVNGGNAVIYLKLEPMVPSGRKKITSLLMILALMVVMAITMFPQYGGASVLDAIF